MNTTKKSVKKVPSKTSVKKKTVVRNNKSKKTPKTITLKKFFLIVVILCSIEFILFYIANAYFTRNSSVKEFIVSDKDYLYEKAIEYVNNNYYDGVESVGDVVKMGVTESNNGDYNYVYLWVVPNTYYVKTETNTSKSDATLYKVVFKDYAIVNCIVPKDSVYVNFSNEELHEFCPNDVVYRAIKKYGSVSPSSFVTSFKLGFDL